MTLPCRVTWIAEEGHESGIRALCESPMGRIGIDLILVPEARVGDFVLTHSGFALQVIPESTARETLRLLGLVQA